MARPKTEARLAADWQTFLTRRCPAARRRLIDAYCPDAIRMAHTVPHPTGTTLEPADLHGVAFGALVTAIDAYETARGVRFTTYAMARIRGEVLQHLRDNDWLSRTARRRIGAIRKTRETLTETLGHPPETEDVAVALALSPEVVREADRWERTSQMLSYEGLLADDLAHELAASEPDPFSQLLARERQEKLAEALSELRERHRHVIRGMFFHQRTSTELGIELGVHATRVRQIRSEALVELRRRLDGDAALFL